MFSECQKMFWVERHGRLTLIISVFYFILVYISVCVTCGRSRAFIRAVKANRSPTVSFSSNATRMMRFKVDARSSTLPVQPRISTATPIAMVWCLGDGGQVDNQQQWNVCVCFTQFLIWSFSGCCSQNRTDCMKEDLLSLQGDLKQDSSYESVLTSSLISVLVHSSVSTSFK